MIDRYLLITSKIEAASGSTVDLYDVAVDRLKAKKWAVYKSTSFKDKIKVEDEIYIYIGKTNSKNISFTSSIIASAKIDKIDDFNKKSEWFETDKYFIDSPVKLLSLKNINHFKKPFGFRDNFKRISFMSNIKKSQNNTLNWGAYMQGGIKRLTADDALLILSQA